MTDPWEEIAARYAEVSDDVRQRFLHPEIVHVARQLQARGRCLDFGCGPGDLTVALAEMFDEVVAVDRAASAREEARRRLGSRASVIDLPTFESRTDAFGAIVLSMVLTTIETNDQLVRVLAMLNGRLAANGRLIIGTTHPCFTFRALSQVGYASSCAPYSVPVAPGIEVSEHHRPLEQVIRCVVTAGLRIVDAREVYDDPEYYRERGEPPHRFAGQLPMFLVLVCDGTLVGDSR